MTSRHSGSNGNGTVNGKANGHAAAVEEPEFTNAEAARLHQTESERALLGAILKAIDVGPVWDYLEPAHFTLHDHQVIFRRMKAMYKRGIEIDRITLAHELQSHSELQQVGGLTFVVGLDDIIPFHPRAESYGRIIFEAAQRRNTIQACAHLMKAVAGDPTSTNLLIKEHRERLDNIAQEGSVFLERDLLESIPPLAGYTIRTRYLLEGLLVEGALTLMTGSYGDGKSTLAMAMGAAIAEGCAFLGRPTLQRPVIVIDRENGIDVVKDRMTRLGIRDDQIPLRVWGLWYDRHGQPPGPDQPELMAYARKYHPLLIWDSLVAFAGCDENSAAEMRSHLSHYRRLAAAGATCLILHHSSEKSESAANYRGSSDIPAAVDTAYHVSRDDGSNAGEALGRMLIKPYKTRISPGSLLRIEYTDEGFVNVDAPPRPAKESVLEYLGQHPGAKQKDLIDALKRFGIPFHRTLDALESSVLSREVESRQGRGRTLKYYLPATNLELLKR